MQETIQLILSIFLGLLPLWILILRARARRQRRQNARDMAGRSPTPEKTVAPPQAKIFPKEQAADTSLLHTDSIWGTQYFTPMQEEEYVEVVEQEEAEPEPEPRVSRARAVASSAKGAATVNKANSVYDSIPSSATRSKALSHLRIVRAQLSRSNLQRAVIFSEILAAPRGIRPLSDEWYEK